MEKREAEFMEKLLITFKSEAEEHLKEISTGLLALEKKLNEQEQKQVLEKIFREAHSLKGAARAVNLDDIQDFCQTIENVFAAWKKNEISLSVKFFDTLHRAIDLIAEVIAAPNKEERLKRANDILEATQKLLDLLKNDSSIGSQETVPASLKETSQGHSPENSKKNQQTSAERHEKTIRVPISKLDGLLQEVEEMLNLKLSAYQQAADLKNIQEQLEKWQKNLGQLEQSFRSSEMVLSESSNPLISNHSKKLRDFFSWEHSFIKTFQVDLNQIVKSTCQESRIVGSMVDSLLDDTKKVLMQPFLTIFESFPRMVRDLSHSLNKQVSLEWSGENIEVDKRILEGLKDPLIHLIRNAIDHGIETPEKRIEKNKLPEGKIKITVSQIGGNRIELLFVDDGRGMNIRKIKECSVGKGIISQKEADSIDDKEVLKLLFHSGISTKEIVTELSGRGLGLGIVAEKVDRLGGQLSIENHKDGGTSFKIVLPTTLATFRGVQVEAFGQQYFIPTHNVVRVVSWNRVDIKNIENKKVIVIDEKVLPIISLGHLLGITQEPSKEKEKQERSPYLPIIIIKATGKIIALEVDKIYGEKDVLVKSLGKLLPHVKNIVAATITEWGKVIPILNPQDLVKSALKDYSEKSADYIPEAIKHTILLCEDSITSRMLLLNILTCSGYQVKAAVDGEEGLSIFEHDHIDLVLTDVEMPRMDGFTLTEKIRTLEKGKNIPIILCTSRDSQEDKERGIKVGANAYLEKSSFTQSNLIDVIHKLL